MPSLPAHPGTRNARMKREARRRRPRSRCARPRDSSSPGSASLRAIRPPAAPCWCNRDAPRPPRPRRCTCRCRRQSDGRACATRAGKPFRMLARGPGRCARSHRRAGPRRFPSSASSSHPCRRRRCRCRIRRGWWVLPAAQYRLHALRGEPDGTVCSGAVAGDAATIPTTKGEEANRRQYR